MEYNYGEHADKYRSEAHYAQGRAGAAYESAEEDLSYVMENTEDPVIRQRVKQAGRQIDLMKQIIDGLAENAPDQ